jgi:hypothetical protein
VPYPATPTTRPSALSRLRVFAPLIGTVVLMLLILGLMVTI